MNAKQSAEVAARTKRIETRLTQLMIAMGVGTEHQKPVFDPGSVSKAPLLVLPSRHTPWSEIAAAVPAGFSGELLLYIGNDRLGSITLAS